MDLSLLELDLTAHISLVKSGKISASEIVAQQLAWIEKTNPAINAFISIAEGSTAFSQNQQSELAGLGVAIKDNIDVSGYATTAGMQTRVGRMATSDAFVAQKLRRAGASFLGKLNMHEGALGATNQNEYFGNCINPHKSGYTPGGSSGGSGAAVAAGMVSIALGTDTMGSVRIPASYCGVFGFKPTKGLVSNHGSVVCSRIMDNIGPIARSANDLMLCMSIISGYDRLNPLSDTSHSFANSQIQSPMVMMVPDDLSALGVARDIIEDFERNITVFKDLGYKINTFSFADYNFAAARRAGLLICEADMRVEHAYDWANHRSKFSPYMQSMLSFIETKSPMDIMACERVLDQAEVFGRGLFENGGYLLLPTTPQRAFSFAEAVPSNQADLTNLANQAGLPAVSMPMLSDHELPAGIQIVGPKMSDKSLLQIAQRWQQVTQFKYQLSENIKSHSTNSRF
ncbi:amidase [Glaciecola punicea]|nr:amidase [Glaciecola punicea]